MSEPDLGFDDIFKECCPNEHNKYGLKREMRFISERIIVEYDPTDHLSVREIMHPMDAFRSHEPYFTHKLADNSRDEYVTAIDFHEHITYFPYAKSTGDVCLARYISNFNDVNFAKISGQELFSMPGEIIHGLRVGRLDKGLVAVNHRTDQSLNNTVTVIDLVKPARNVAYFDSIIPVNTIDWIWHSPFLLAVGDDKSLRIMDIRCPKAFNAVFFEGGVRKTALSSTRPLEIACWDGSNVLFYDVRRPEVPCVIHDIGLESNEDVTDMKFNPYIIDELFVHTTQHRVFATKVNPVRLIGGRVLAEKPYDKWQVITFKHIDRGCTSTRHMLKRRQLMPYQNAEIPLLDYYGQYEAAKKDEEVPLPAHWKYPSEADESFLDRINDVPEIDYESYLYKTVERCTAEFESPRNEPNVFYEAKSVETFDFVFPGVNGIMCFDRSNHTYKIVRSPKHYEGSINPYVGSDSVHFYRGLQIQEMIPAQTLTMMCNRLHDGWNAYQLSERSLKRLAFKITDDTRSMWSDWLRNSAIIQYGGSEFAKIGEDGQTWKDYFQLPEGAIPEPEILPYDYRKDDIATEDICQMIAPFFRLFLPDPRPDLKEGSDDETELNIKPRNPYERYEDDKVCDNKAMPADLSQSMKILCKCHAKMRNYNSNPRHRRYQYSSMGNTFFIAASKRIREKFFKVGWKDWSKPDILDHRQRVDAENIRISIIDELPRFQRYRPREFQKRVLPPKLITDSNSVFMKPEYIKEREQKEKEMREKAAQPIEAPIGMSLPKSSKKPEKKKAKDIPDVSGEDDPEKARFLIRAALQLADSSDDEIPLPKETPPAPPPAPVPDKPAVKTPQAFSLKNDKDDFEYETAEDAYFGIKKKRMYVVYQPATKPLALRRYKPDRLAEHTFVRRLEHLMYWGKRSHEKKILYGKYKEDPTRLSSVKERATLDLKLALNNHIKVGWQTFFDKNFFFSNKCSYNQILRKAVQFYNRLCDDIKTNTFDTHVRHERLFCGVQPKMIDNDVSDKERGWHRFYYGVSTIKNDFSDDETEESDSIRPDDNLTIIENTTIGTYNQFMNYLQCELPLKLDFDIFEEEFKGDVPYRAVSRMPREERIPDAEYDRDEQYMFPMGKLRFCEYDIPPDLMAEIERRRIPVSPEKPKSLCVEDCNLTSASAKIDYSGLRRCSSLPDLGLDFRPTENRRRQQEKSTNVALAVMGRLLLQEYQRNRDQRENLTLENFESYLSAGVFNRLALNRTKKNMITFQKRPALTYFPQWESPMINETDRETGEKYIKRVVPLKEPQPPRQLEGIDPMFDYINVDVMLKSKKNLHVSYIINDPILDTWPGLQILDNGRKEMFTLSADISKRAKDLPIDFFKSPLMLPDENARIYKGFFTETTLLHRNPSKSRPRPPIFEEHSTNIPPGLIQIMKPGFYGLYDSEYIDRYTEAQAYDLRNRRELQQALFENRMIMLRQPMDEEKEHSLGSVSEEDVNVEEDDLKTSSSEESMENASIEVDVEPAIKPPPVPIKFSLKDDFPDTINEPVDDDEELEDEQKKTDENEEGDEYDEDEEYEYVDEEEEEYEEYEEEVDEEEEEDEAEDKYRMYDFWRIFEKQESTSEEESDSDSDVGFNRRKHGVIHKPEVPVYSCYNPHTRANIRKESMEEDAVDDENRDLSIALAQLFSEELVREKLAGECPYGSPRKTSLRPGNNSDDEETPKDETEKTSKSVTWGNVTTHSIELPPVQRRGRHFVEVDAEFLKSLEFIEEPMISKSASNLFNFKPTRKNSDPTAILPKELPRRSSLDQFCDQEEAIACTDCIDEPWPTREECINCCREVNIYKCTTIADLKLPCYRCGKHIYKFSCMNYDKNTYPNRTTIRKQKREPTDEEFREKLAVHNETVKPEDTPAIWSMKSYKPGNSTLDIMLSRSNETKFRSCQKEQLAEIYYREFHWVTWRMDDDKAERVVVSEEFDVAFNRDADIDMMRDTMNTISQDGEMDMMTTYDQRSGMRVRRWISYAALATRVQKQSEKARLRKRAAEKEARILAGEINVKPALLTELKKKAHDKEAVSTKNNEMDEKTRQEERRRLYLMWKKEPIPEFPEDTRKMFPDFKLPKSEDWLESSGSEDELPPIRSRILSKGMKEFIANIRNHMEKKPKNFNGLRVTYGKLFEKRPILKNDIVLVTRRRKPKRKPPKYKIQRLPLSTTWLHSSLTVAFEPPPQKEEYEKDSLKWTVPFYNSKQLALNDQETRHRAFRPPSPPAAIKEGYQRMKHIEQAILQQKRVKMAKAVKKARKIRQLRYHRRLYGQAKVRSNAYKAWTIARRKAVHTKPENYAPLPPSTSYPSDVFCFTTKTKEKQVLPRKRVQSKMSSSSDTEYCSVVELPDYADDADVAEIAKRMLPSILKKKRTRKQKTELKRDAKSVTFNLKPTVVRYRLLSVSDDRSRVTRSKEAKDNALQLFGTAEVVEIFDEQSEKPIQNKIDVVKDDAANQPISKISDEISSVSAVKTSDKKKSRSSRKKERKVNTNSKAKESTKNTEEKHQKKRTPKEPSVPKRRTKSTPAPISKKSRKEVVTRRSFSVDTGSRNSKLLEKLARKHKRSLQKKRQPSKRATEDSTMAESEQREQEIAVEANAVPQSRKKSSKSLDGAKPVIPTTTFLESMKRGSNMKPAKCSKKLKLSVDDFLHVNSSQKFCTTGNKIMHPLHPRWIPTDHETDKAGRESDSCFHLQHMRDKLLTRSRKILHRAPTRSRVLNTVRKLKFTRQDNRMMMHEPSLKPKYADLFIHPWHPIPIIQNKKKRRSPQYVLKKNPAIFRKSKNVLDEPNVHAYSDYVKRQETLEPPKEYLPEPLSWSRLLRKLTNFKIVVKRVRLLNVKKLKKNDSDSIEPVEKLLEVIVEPVDNLKSCLKQHGAARRTLHFSSQPAGEQEKFVGFGGTLTLVKPPSHAEAAKLPNASKVPLSVFEKPSTAFANDSWITDARRNEIEEKQRKAEELALREEQHRLQQLSVITESPARDDERSESRSPSSPARLLRSVATTPESTRKDDSDDEEDEDEEDIQPAVIIPTPPPKAPADQQWRAAMMARRYMGASKPVYTKSPKKKEEFENFERDSKPMTDVRSPIKATTAPPQLPRMTPSKSRDPRGYQEPVAKPKATAPPPSRGQQVPTQFGSDSSGDEGIWKNISKEKPGTSSGKEDKALSSTEPGTSSKKDEKKLEGTTPSSNLASPSGIPTSSTAKSSPRVERTSFFTALFGRKRVPPSPLAVQTTEKAAEPKTSPILPRVKRGESGTLMKKSPTAEVEAPAPKPVPSPAETIVKFIDGKPIFNSPTYAVPMSQRRRKAASAAGSGSGSSSSSSDSDEESKKASTSRSPNPPPPPPPAPKPVLKAPPTEVDHGEGTSSSGKLIPKSVRFGSTSYQSPESDKPEPVVEKPPPPEPRAEISFETLAEEMFREQREREAKEKKAQVPEPEPVPEHVEPPKPAAPLVVEPTPSRTASRLTFFGLSPFGKVTPRKTPTTMPEQPSATPPVATPAPETSRPPVKSTPATKSLSTPGPSTPILSSRNEPSTSNDYPSTSSARPEKADSSRPVVRKDSTRPQFRPTVALSSKIPGADSLPKPANLDPEPLPQIDPPKGVQKYNPVSQQKHYTRFGQRYVPPKTKMPFELRYKLPKIIPRQSTPEPTPPPSPPPPPPLPFALPPPLPPSEKKKRRKKKPEPVEISLVLDGTKYFEKTTPENLAIMNREFDLKYVEKENSEKGNQGDAGVRCDDPFALIAEIRKCHESAIAAPPTEEMHKIQLHYNPDAIMAVDKKSDPSKTKPKYETVRKKLNRMEANRKLRINATGLNSLSKRQSVFNTVRQVRKVRFFLENNKKMTAPVTSNFKPKSILKSPKSEPQWLYKIDLNGNKLYMRKLGPSDWQKKQDARADEPKEASIIKKKKSATYLQQYVKVMKHNAKMMELFVHKPKNTVEKPEDVFCDKREEYLPPTRSLSSETVSTNASLNSLLDALNAVDKPKKALSASQELLPTTTPPVSKRVRSVSENNADTIEEPPKLSKEHPMDTIDEPMKAFKPNASNLLAEPPKLSKHYPLVYVGATVSRSPSTSNANINEPISSMAEDGSEILEYVGKEETPEETIKRRFDPFTRPISALMKALSINAPELATEAGRTKNRSLIRFFGRSFSPETNEGDDSDLPLDLQFMSESQGSSAEDILALMQDNPDALETMEGISIPLLSPLMIFGPHREGTPMWRKQQKLKHNLYGQFKNMRIASDRKRIWDYLDYYDKYSERFDYSDMYTLINMKLKQNWRFSSKPGTSIAWNAIGKYDPNSIRVQSNSRFGFRHSSSIIVKHIKRCQERFEMAKQLVQRVSAQQLSETELVKKTKWYLKHAIQSRKKKIRVMYKFKRTCIKFKVEVKISKECDEFLKNQSKSAISELKEILSRISLNDVKKESFEPVIKENVVSDFEDENDTGVATDYDGDSDEDEKEDLETQRLADNKPIVALKNQRSKLLRRYFQFSVKMARKIARRAVGVPKPFVFYAFLSKLRARMRSFMDVRRKDQMVRKMKSEVVRESGIVKTHKLRKNSERKKPSKRTVPPLQIREALKKGSTTPKRVVVDQSRYDFLKMNVKFGTFFQCLEEYIDVGTPIKLIYRFKTTLLPKKMFDTGKKDLIDPVVYTSPSPCNTDSDFSDDSPEDPTLAESRKFFARESLESTYNVKGLPGLIYLARLVQERVGDDVERNISFSGPVLEASDLIVYMTPIRRLMLNSLGLRMPDRVEESQMARYSNEKFELWFARLYKMMCYGRGDLVQYVIDKIALGQGPPNKKYDKMDVSYQAHIIYKLFKKMLFILNGREAKLAIIEFNRMELEDEDNQSQWESTLEMKEYDRMLYGIPKPWTRDNWIEACDQFLNFSKTKPNVLVHCQASIVLMRMIFTGGYSQDIIDQLLSMKLPLRDKLLFIINLTPPEYIVENIVKTFHTARGLDRLPFVGLGYHADPLRVLFEEAVESGDPQLIAHIARVGRCLDRRSREPMMTDCGSDHIKNRDLSTIISKVFTNDKARRPYGAPTMNEMFPFRYVRHSDGTEVTETTEELAELIECEVTRYMAILELTKGAAITKGDLDHNPKFNTYPNRFFVDVLCTGCKMNIAKGRNLGRLGRTLCVSTMPLIEQDKDKKRWPRANTMSPRLTYENYIETLDPTENKMLMAKDIEEEKTDITVQVLPSRFGCFECRFSLPRCVICMIPYLNDHMDYALKEFNERYSQFSICNICNHGGHINHIAEWFETEKYCPVAGCDCKCLRSKQIKNLKGRLRRHMILSANMRAKSHLCNPECATEADIDEGFLPDPDLALMEE